MADEKRVRAAGAIRSVGVARFWSGSHAAALGRPGGVRRQLHQESRVTRAPYSSSGY